MVVRSGEEDGVGITNGHLLQRDLDHGKQLAMVKRVGCHGQGYHVGCGTF